MRGTAGGHRPGSPSCSTMACMSRMTAPVILRAIATCRHSMESICDTSPTAPQPRQFRLTPSLCCSGYCHGLPQIACKPRRRAAIPKPLPRLHMPHTSNSFLG